MVGPVTARGRRGRVVRAAAIAIVAVSLLSLGPGLPDSPTNFPRTAAGPTFTPSTVRPASVGPDNATSPLAWLDVTGSAGQGAPFPRAWPAMAFDPALNATILFGGLDSVSSPCCSQLAYGDMWSFANGKWTDLTPTVLPPPARYQGLMAWDPVDHYLVLYGGFSIIAKTGAIVELNDTWAFANDSWEQLHPRRSPPGTVEGTMAWDARDGYLLMYGGVNQSIQGAVYSDYISRDTWSFVGGQWTNRTSTVVGAPPPVEEQEMAYDPGDQGVVMFGGDNATLNLNATWTYAGGTWARVDASSGPPGVSGAVMATDPALDGAILFGGYHETNYPDYSATMERTTWLFAHGNWTNLTASLPSAPAAGLGASISDVSSGGYLLLFGAGGRNVTWLLGPPVIGGFVATPSPTDVGVATELNATPIAATGTVSYSYSGLPPGCAGDNDSVLQCTPRSIGTYPVTITLNDSIGYSTTEKLTLRVNPHPEFAAFSATPAALTLGAPISFVARATGGTPAYRYSFEELPPGCVFRGAVNFTCTPTAAGVSNVTVTLTDLAGGSAAANVTVVVNVPTGIATFAARAPTIDLGQELNLSVGVAGGTPPYSYFYSGLPANCLSFDTPELSCAPGATGPFTISARVNDSFGSYASAATNVLIDPTPTILSFQVAPVHADVGSLVAVSVEATGGTAPFQYAFVDLPPGCSGATVAAFDCTPTGAGNFTVGAVVTDGAGYVLHASGALFVAPQLLVRSFNGTPDPIDAGESITIATDASGGTAPFTYVYRELPTGCGGASAATFTCEPAAGTYQTTVTISDAIGATNSETHVFVVAPALGLELAGPNSTQIDLGGSVTVSALPIGGTFPYRWAYTGLPPGCASQNASNLTCTPAVSGSFSVTVTLSDAAGERSSVVLAMSVSSPQSAWPTLLLGSAAVVALVAAAVLLLRRRRRRRDGIPP